MTNILQLLALSVLVAAIMAFTGFVVVVSVPEIGFVEATAMMFAGLVFTVGPLAIVPRSTGVSTP